MIEGNFVMCQLKLDQVPDLEQPEGRENSDPDAGFNWFRAQESFIPNANWDFEHPQNPGSFKSRTLV